MYHIKQIVSQSVVCRIFGLWFEMQIFAVGKKYVRLTRQRLLVICYLLV